MDEQNIADAPRKRFRRLIRGAVVFVGVGLIMVASLPTLLGTAPARRWLVKTVNERVQPGRIELEGLSLSWIRGVGLRNLKLMDPQGKQVFSAASVATGRGVLGLIASRFDPGVIRIEGATLDVERRADGSIDVVEALGRLASGGGPAVAEPPQPSGPGMAIAVEVAGGRLRIASPELVEPIEAQTFEASATLAPGAPMKATARLVDGERSLELELGCDADAAAGDLDLKLTGRDWPIAVREAGVKAGGRLVGTLEAGRRSGLWTARGDAVLHAFTAEGPGLAGDRLLLERLSADCDVEQTTAGWSIRKFDVRCPIAEVTAKGAVPADHESPFVSSGHLDLAAASRLLPRAIPLRQGIVIEEGRVRFRAELSRQEQTERLEASVDVTDLAATDGRRPLTLSEPAQFAAALVRTGGDVKVETFRAKAAGVSVTAAGDLATGVKLSGTFDLEAAQAQAGRLMDLGALELAGQGKMAADYKIEAGAFRGRLAAEIGGLKVAGATADPILREKVRLDAVAEGPSDPVGLPADWTGGRVVLKAGDTVANLLMKATGEIVVEGKTPITSPAAAVAAGRVAMRRTGAFYTLDDVRLSATPTDPGASGAALSLIANGRLDPAAGHIVLIPVGAQPATGLGIGPEGLMVSGLRASDPAMKLDTVLFGDLSRLDQALAYWTQSSLLGLGGGWKGRLTASRTGDGRIQFESWVASPDLVYTTPRGAVSLAVNGVYTSEADHLEMSHVDFSTIYGRLTGAGTIGEVTSRRLAAVAGSFEPRWETIDAILASSLEPGAQVRGAVRPFLIRGPFSGDSASQILKGLEGELGVDVASARAFGMELGPAPVVLRLGGGAAVFAPIATTLNGGAVAVAADLMLDDPNALWLRLGPGTKIEDAAINDAVSNSVLSYIAPVLSQASRASGQVSLTIQNAVVPLIGDGSLGADGQLVFKDVIFQPGPFASEVVSLTRRKVPTMSLKQPVQLQIADGRVKQSGLSIPLTDDLKANLEGSVGFDETLAMRVSVPITPEMLGGNQAANRFVNGTNITLPVGGTLSHPVLDRSGLRVALREAARSMVKRGVQAEAGRLLERVAPSSGDADASDGSLRNDALKALEGVGRDLLKPRRR